MQKGKKMKVVLMSFDYKDICWGWQSLKVSKITDDNDCEMIALNVGKQRAVAKS